MVKPIKTIRIKFDKTRDVHKFYKYDTYLCTIKSVNLEKIARLISYYGTQTFMVHIEYLNKRMNEHINGTQYVNEQKRQRLVAKYEGRSLVPKE